MYEANATKARNSVVLSTLENNGAVDADKATEWLMYHVKDPDEAFALVDVAICELADEGFLTTYGERMA